MIAEDRKRTEYRKGDSRGMTAGDRGRNRGNETRKAGGVIAGDKGQNRGKETGTVMGGMIMGLIIFITSVTDDPYDYDYFYRPQSHSALIRRTIMIMVYNASVTDNPCDYDYFYLPQSHCALIGHITKIIISLTLARRKQDDFIVKMRVLQALLVLAVVSCAVLALPRPETEPITVWVGGCAGTRYGCCPDGVTARHPPESNTVCPTVSGQGYSIPGL
ncbi:hypothetical protein RRG08_062229 [Elysia crispata]|uniref:Uncharacterized protein n=1 Tax=Elysia crispata TaxID=231223 RepID=A0AAE1CUT9_9GAST|nr:hypothetical protein RRG08_062229 [Elysia crispata]